MTTYRVGAQLRIGEWPQQQRLWQVTELEWLPPHQRLIVRMRDAEGRELSMTPHELRTNGATNA